MNVYSIFDGEIEAVEVGTAESWQAAGQQLADQSGCVYVYAGTAKKQVQDCECSEPRESCPDSDNGTEPCVFRDGVECWLFDAYMEPSDIAYTGQDPDGPEVFRPKAAS